MPTALIADDERLMREQIRLAPQEQVAGVGRRGQNAAGAERGRGDDRRGHRPAALYGDGAGVHGQLVGLGGVVGVLLDGAAELLHRRGRLLDRKSVV